MQLIEVEGVAVGAGAWSRSSDDGSLPLPTWMASTCLTLRSAALTSTASVCWIVWVSVTRPQTHDDHTVLAF